MFDFDLVFPQKRGFIPGYKHGKTDISTPIYRLCLSVVKLYQCKETKFIQINESITRQKRNRFKARNAIRKFKRIVITVYSPSCLGKETANGPFGVRVKLPLPTYLPHTVEASHCLFNAEYQAGKL